MFFPAKPEKTSITFEPKEPKIGESVNITCTSIGVPEPRYSIIHNDTIQIITYSTEKMYTINNVQWNDTGKYECVATNELGDDSAFDDLKISGKLNVGKTTYFTLRKLKHLRLTQKGGSLALS